LFQKGLFIMKTVTPQALFRACVVAALFVAASLPATHAYAQHKHQEGAKKGVACADAVFVTLKLKGLHCEGCAGAVKSGLLSVAGVESADVNAKTQTAVVGLCGKKTPGANALKAAVKKAGYAVVTVIKGKPKAPASGKG